MSVKSAVRVLEVLEFFDTVQRDASLSEIAIELGYPLSSASVLLQSLVKRGYLSQGDTRLYRLTPRVKLLGAWLSPMLDANGPYYHHGLGRSSMSATCSFGCAGAHASSLHTDCSRNKHSSHACHAWVGTTFADVGPGTFIHEQDVRR
jgi:hypothetical protein